MFVEGRLRQRKAFSNVWKKRCATNPAKKTNGEADYTTSPLQIFKRFACRFCFSPSLRQDHGGTECTPQ